MLAVASVVFGLLAVIPTGLIACGYRWGWLVALAFQVPWCVYDLVTGQPGLLLITVVFGPVYWAGWVRARRPPPQVTAGDAEHHTWCPVCQAPLRVRVPLTLAGRPAGVLEICPGCGTGHDHNSVTVTRSPPQPRPRRPHLAARAARWFHGLIARRAGVPALECAWGDCLWPGLWRLVVEVPGEDGTWRYVFCRRSHQRAWATGYGIIIDPHLGMGEEVVIPHGDGG